ncbi:hypothetical protein BRADI_1g06435v3 [Brachypodium distachyon]|uniref:Uncharacterized protein n=1 Tax=Brachypodium distachyon TaxID=15368 RepID=A0A0Q3GP95_BRADI|nr:hypothetical protein BRADI_1g06435v3 [Brachypodium distachyon]
MRAKRRTRSCGIRAHVFISLVITKKDTPESNICRGTLRHYLVRPNEQKFQNHIAFCKLVHLFELKRVRGYPNVITSSQP